MTKRTIITRKLIWRGRLVVVREQHDYLWLGQSHVEIYAVRPKRARLPITDTGYRSHFIESDELSLAGGAVNFVQAWLDREASSKSWLRIEHGVRQLTLDL